MHTSSTQWPAGGEMRIELPPGVDSALDRHQRLAQPRLKRLWDYYRNPMDHSPAASLAWRAGQMSGGRGYRLAQERGLPARLSASGSDARGDDRAWARKEIVVENDIGWRIQTMVDFMFGRPVAIASSARDANLRRRIERVLDAVWEASGGISLLQDIALLGNVYGYVDLIVRRVSDGVSGVDAHDDEAVAAAAADTVRIEVIEPTRGTAVFSPNDHRAMTAYAIRASRPAEERGEQKPKLPPGTGLARWLGFDDRNARLLGGGGGNADMVQITEVLTAESALVYEQHGTKINVLAEDDNLVSPGEVPVVHIQNISQPFCYDGLSEVEPLMPLQDELNTRLSDRACRVTFQSFKMFLAKGLDGLDKAPFGPGQVWQTDNPDAHVEAIGGDAASPSEDKHIEEIREAMDKTSGVPPLAAGVVRAKIGNLTSENALRVTLMGLLSKTARKRVTYGRGIAEASRLVLMALDVAGVLKTDVSERRVRVEWPDALPRNEQDLLNAAEKKIALGISRERVLSELGYSASDPGVV